MRKTLIPGQDWVETSAQVVASTYRYARFLEVDLEDGLDHSRYLITFRYAVEGKLYVGEMEQFEPLEEHSELPILYNPGSPDQNSLSLYPSRPSSLILKAVIVIAVAAAFFVLDHYYGGDFSEF